MAEEMDVKSYIDETVEFNRHVAGILLIKAEGGDATEDLTPISSNVSPIPDPEVIAALNRSFFEGEQQDPAGIELASHRLHVSERLEIREIAVVVLQEAPTEDPNPVNVPEVHKDEEKRADSKAPEIGENEAGGAMTEGGVKPSDFIRSDHMKEKVTVETIATCHGAVLSTSRKWVLAVTFEPGMNIDFTKQVAAGLAEFLAGEGE
mmetsp:Transcript_50083/g.106536  ORF Transcript_50083/g.106536 Transcript_50083/m.106536 type:complete len:206 (+) Transcript_50083:152-769(+)